MKVQDLIFLVIFILVLIKRDSKSSAIAGLVCLALSIPLFSFWVFFTAQRFTYYAAAFFLVATILLVKSSGRNR